MAGNRIYYGWQGMNDGDYREVYLGIGGNIGDAKTVLKKALQQIAALDDVIDFRVSRFYQTKPVSDIPQDDFVNAVCSFKTRMNARALLLELQQIEVANGKKAKPKNAPREIDIDILFFGVEQHQSEECEIPHPRWKERLFVIIPLMDLISSIAIPRQDCESSMEYIDLMELRRSFAIREDELVKVLPDPY